MGKPKIDMTGLRFSRWTVLAESRNDKTTSTATYWECVCDCGTKKIINGTSLRSGRSQSCGCLRDETSKENMTKMRLEKSGTIQERFFSRFFIDQKTGCWEWTAHRDKDGYGVLPGDKKNTRAHRLSYEIHNGEIPDGLFVCHKCDNPGCVNPDHLFTGTAKDNNRDALMKGRNFIGEKNGNAKLSYENVKEILSSELNGQQLADKFGVTRATINAIRRGETWARSH